MWLGYAVLGASMALEIINSVISIMGMTVKAGNPYLLTLSICFEVITVALATALYTYWKDVNWKFQFFLLPIVGALMVVAGSGSYGYLVNEWSHTTLNTDAAKIVLEEMVKERTKLEARKVVIDQTITSTTAEYNRKSQIVEYTKAAKADRERVLNALSRTAAQFQQEQTSVTTRLTELDKSIPEQRLKTAAEKNAGGIFVTIGEAWNIAPMDAMRWAAIIIVFLMHPTSILGIMFGTFILLHHAKAKHPMRIDDVMGRAEDVALPAGLKASPPAPPEPQASAPSAYPFGDQGPASSPAVPAPASTPAPTSTTSTLGARAKKLLPDLSRFSKNDSQAALAKKGGEADTSNDTIPMEFDFGDLDTPEETAAPIATMAQPALAQGHMKGQTSLSEHFIAASSASDDAKIKTPSEVITDAMVSTVMPGKMQPSSASVHQRPKKQWTPFSWNPDHDDVGTGTNLVRLGSRNTSDDGEHHAMNTSPAKTEPSPTEMSYDLGDILRGDGGASSGSRGDRAA